MPSELYAIELVAVPPATHKVPFQATPYATVEKIEFPFAEGSQLIPSVL